MSAVHRSFLREAEREAQACNRESGVLRLLGDPVSGHPPSRFHGLLREVQHFVREPGGAVHVSDDPIPFSIHLPEDYLRSVDPALQFRIVELHAPLFHPNVRGPLVCMGSRFRPGTRLRSVVEHVYALFASHVFATEDAFCPEARDFYRRHTARARSLQAAPLWRRPLAAR
ncbi:MAG: hypothetical protein ABFS46_22290, partial [Myxococcota bacterium]